MPLSTEDLIATDGIITGHVFENPAAGVPRALYWSIRLDYEPLVLDGTDWECNAGCEFLRWPLDYWKKLDGATLDDTIGPVPAEGSIYLIGAHHELQLQSLALHRIEDTTRFEVRLEAKFDLRGYGELDGTDIPLSLACVAEFKHVVVVRDNLFPKPSDAEEAAAVVAPFLDIEGLTTPRRDDFRFVFEPVV